MNQGQVHVEIFNLGNPKDKVCYEEILNKHETGDISIMKEQFTFSKSNPPIPTIVVWYREN